MAIGRSAKFNLTGIDGSGATGRTPTSAAGIDGSGATGRTPTSATGIDGSGTATRHRHRRTAPLPTSAAGIDGSGATGRTPTSATGIDGSGATGRTPTSAAGIDGSWCHRLHPYQRRRHRRQRHHQLHRACPRRPICRKQTDGKSKKRCAAYIITRGGWTVFSGQRPARPFAASSMR